MRTRIWFDPPLFRWSRVLGVAVAGIGAVVGWIAYERGVWQPVEVARPGVVFATASGVALSKEPPAPIRVAANAARAASVPDASASSVRVPAADELDVCGRGLVKVKPGPGSDQEAQARELTDSPGRERWLAAMRASGDVKVRAASILLEANGFTDTEGTEGLARLALSSLDPTVYGWALYACQPLGGHTPPSACMMLSYERWAALAPTKGLPWLLLVTEPAAQGRIDPREAMYRASRAESVGSSTAALATLALGAQPAGVTPMDRYAMMVQARGISAALDGRVPYPSKYCEAGLLRDPDRRQQCEAVAQLLATKAENPFDLAIAVGLGSRLGWSAERLKALRDEQAALQYASLELVIGGQPMSCASIERLTTFMHDSTRLSPVGAARELIRHSGKSVTEYRAAMEKEMAARLPPAASDAGT